MTEQELFLEMAGIPLRILHREPIHDSLGLLERYKTAPGDPAHTYRISLTQTLPVPNGREVYTSPGLRIFRDGDAVARYHGTVSVAVEAGYSCALRRGSETQIWFREELLQEGVTGKLLLNSMDLTHHLTRHNALLLHASYIAYQGKAILFTAPSETGKSTQARLWCDCLGAELVNGDRAAVGIRDGWATAWGVPFSGSSPVRRNVTLPLAAIVWLSQAKENTITPLTGLRAFRRIWEGCTLNIWDSEEMDLATRTVSEIVAGVPIYHLACTPDVRAVELLKQTLEVTQ